MPDQLRIEQQFQHVIFTEASLLRFNALRMPRLNGNPVPRHLPWHMICSV
jgi:hypothetical protein